MLDSRVQADSCGAALSAVCGGLGAGPGECECAFDPKNADALMVANCSALIIQDFYGCGGTASHCFYDQQAGQMWEQRAFQYLVSNGVAVVQVFLTWT